MAVGRRTPGDLTAYNTQYVRAWREFVRTRFDRTLPAAAGKGIEDAYEPDSVGMRNGKMKKN